MARIYAWDELEAGRYASKENIQKALEHAKPLMESLHKHGWIESVSIFGSSARGDYQLGSDIDALVISTPEKQDKVQKLLRSVFRTSVKRFGVEPNIIHLTSTEARSGDHTLIPTFLEHIRRNASGGLSVGKDPGEIVNMRRADPLERAREQVAAYHKSARDKDIKLLVDMTGNREAFRETIGAAASRTIHTARMVLDVLGKLPRKNGKIVDTKPEVLGQYSQVFSEKPEVLSRLNKITYAMSRYEEALKNGVSALKTGDKEQIALAKTKYEESLNGLAGVLPDYEKFLLENLRILREEIDKRHGNTV